ncbi:hypothetical protein SH668x_001205 [Planctomicrobium sp. SH668]
MVNGGTVAKVDLENSNGVLLMMNVSPEHLEPLCSAVVSAKEINSVIV